MGSLGEAVLDLTADASKIDSGLDSAQKKVGGALNDMKGTFSTATGVMLGQLSAGALRDVGDSILRMGKEAFQGIAEGELAQAQLNAVLESTGGIAGVTADQVNELALAYRQLTLFDDDAIIGGESLLLTFTNIGQEVFPEATKTMLDMSQALKQDLKSSATQLGKALQDPILGVTALRKVGVNFTEGQQDMIKTLVESGKIMEAQKFILKELQTEFGGSAEAAGQTMAGQLEILNWQFNEVKEGFVSALMPVITQFIDLAKALLPYLQKGVELFSSLPTPIKTGVAALIALIAVAGPLIGIISTIVSAVGTIGPAVGAIVSAVGAAIGGISGAAAAVTPILATIGAALFEIILPIAAIIALIYLLYLAWTENWGGIRDIGIQLWEDIKAGFQEFMSFLRQLWESDFGGMRSYFETLWKVIQSVWNAVSAAFRGDWTAFGQYLRQAWDAIWNFIVGRFQATVNTILNLGKMIVEGIKLAFQIDWRQLGTNIINGLVNGLKNGAKAVAEAARGVARNALDAAKGFLGIQSPSKAFMELGNFSGVGFMQGLQTSLSPVGVSNIMERVMTAGGQAASRSLQNNITVNNPTPERASTSVDKTLRNLSYLGIVK